MAEPLCFLLSKKGGNVLKYKDSLFRRSKVTYNRSYWKCIKPRCKASVILDSDLQCVLSSKELHAHAIDTTEMESTMFIFRLRLRVNNEPYTPIPRIYREELSKVPPAADYFSALPTYDAIKTRLYDERSSAKPSLLGKSIELNLTRMWTKILDEKSFLMPDDNSESHKLLVSSRNEAMKPSTNNLKTIDDDENNSENEDNPPKRARRQPVKMAAKKTLRNNKEVADVDMEDFRSEEPSRSKLGRKGKATETKLKADEEENKSDEMHEVVKLDEKASQQQNLEEGELKDEEKLSDAPKRKRGNKDGATKQSLNGDSEKIKEKSNDDAPKKKRGRRIVADQKETFDEGSKKVEEKEALADENKVDKEETVKTVVKKGRITKAKPSAGKQKIPDVTVLDFSNNSSSKDGKPWNIKLSSWNVNGVRAWLEKGGITYLEHEQPDILCIQETKCSTEKVPGEIKTVDGYFTYWLSGDKEGYSGIALLSKKKPISVKYGIDSDEHDNEGRVITAEYENFYLVTAYVPNAGRGLVRLDYRMQWDRDFTSYLKKLDVIKPIILCGDLNVSHQEIDLANPKTNKRNAGFTQEERDGFSALLEEGFIDSFRHLYPEAKNAYTFWTYMMNARAKDVGWRLDYFIISNKLSGNLCDSVIRKDVMGSDHCPVTLFMTV